MHASFAWFGAVDHPRAERAKYSVKSACPVCGRKHITVFRLRHVSDSFFAPLSNFYRYARHFNFRRLRWCPNSNQSPKWDPR